MNTLPISLASIVVGVGALLLAYRSYRRTKARLRAVESEVAAGSPGSWNVDPGPDCDRCGKPTNKPFLYRMPRTPWRCESCERIVTDIMLLQAAPWPPSNDLKATLQASRDRLNLLRAITSPEAGQAAASIDQDLERLFRRPGPLQAEQEN
jgi:hypothetical protein